MFDFLEFYTNFIIVFHTYLYTFIFGNGYNVKTDTFVTVAHGRLVCIPNVSKLVSLVYEEPDLKTGIRKGVLFDINQKMSFSIPDCAVADTIEEYFKKEIPYYHIQRFPPSFMKYIEQV